jgi:putative ABC transport system permease protein
VVDRLALTAIESVWAVHGMEPHETEHQEAAGAAVEQRPLEITSLLLHFRSPLGAVELPRLVNQESALQAASPALESARLLSLVGIGLDTMRAFGLLLVASAGLGVLIALSNAMQERRYDLAVMRTLGASRRTLLAQPLLEGLILAAGGALLGLLLGHGVAELLGRLLPQARDMGLTGLIWRAEELAVVGLALGVGLLAALIPAIQAYRTDIAAVLASRA